MKPSLFAETLLLGKLSWLNFRKRGRRSLSALIGIVGVVAVFVSVISIARGYHEVVKITEASDNVMVMMTGATSEIISTLSAEQVNLIKQSTFVKRGADQSPVASAEVLTTFKLTQLGNGSKSASVRGVEPASFALKGIKIISGRSFAPGRRELIVGRRVMQQMDNLKVGDQTRLGNSMWTVVGVFEAASGLTESELWVDSAMLQAIKQQGNSASVVYLQLAPDVTLRSFEKAMADDPRINANVLTENQYISDQSDSMTGFVEIIGYSITFLMSLGAIFAALNTGYAGVIQRAREIATLKAIGFRDQSILLSVLVEALAMSVIGGWATALVCYWIFDGFTVATILGSHSYSAVVFSFKVSLSLMLQAVGIAAAIGIVGALYPSFAIINLPVARALARRK